MLTALESHGSSVELPVSKHAPSTALFQLFRDQEKFPTLVDTPVYASCYVEQQEYSEVVSWQQDPMTQPMFPDSAHPLRHQTLLNELAYATVPLYEKLPTNWYTCEVEQEHPKE
jgi:hypothetical protein